MFRGPAQALSGSLSVTQTRLSLPVCHPRSNARLCRFVFQSSALTHRSVVVTRCTNVILLRWLVDPIVLELTSPSWILSGFLCILPSHATYLPARQKTWCPAIAIALWARACVEGSPESKLHTLTFRSPIPTFCQFALAGIGVITSNRRSLTQD